MQVLVIDIGVTIPERIFELLHQKNIEIVAIHDFPSLSDRELRAEVCARIGSVNQSIMSFDDLQAAFAENEELLPVPMEIRPCHDADIYISPKKTWEQPRRRNNWKDRLRHRK